MDYSKYQTNVSGVDFSKHELTVQESDFCTIYAFAKPNTICQSIIFINMKGELFVTGDYGRWSFCRELHPSHDGFISRDYWDGKLVIESKQKASYWDGSLTLRSLREELWADRPLNKDYISFLKRCLGYAEESESEDEYYAKINDGEIFHDYDYEYEDIISESKRFIQLDIIYDAFNEICKRMGK